MSQHLAVDAESIAPQYSAPSHQPHLHSLSVAITCPDDIYRLCHRQRGLKQEVLRVISLTDQYRVIRSTVVSRGTLGTFVTHPREVYRPAILAGAEAILLVHNHPNGDLRPSSADLALTQMLYRAGQILGIRLLDHVIVASSGYISLATMGEIPKDSLLSGEAVHR